jgi:AcrR family transcriptional regulator
MARSYTLKRRAEQQAETRRRIVEAAVDLHGTLGPAHTSLSMVAERAGVQRNTLYAHFPDERSLAMACSGLHFERHPAPEAEPWASLNDPAVRLRTGLAAIWGWYAETAELTGCVLRDAEHHELTREIVMLRLGATAAAWREVLGAGFSQRQLALLHLALSFPTWRALVQEAGLDPAAAVETMTAAILGAEGATPPPRP